MKSTTSVAIINVDTAAFSALAALSALRHVPFPLRLIDCSRMPQQRDACKSFCDELGILREEWPLQVHGRTLDRLFAETESDWLVLLDSDAEILDPASFLDALKLGIEQRSYGAGWLQPTGRAADAGSPINLYMERPWVPFCAFRVDAVGRLLKQGASFEAHRIHNDLCWLPEWLRRVVAYRRHLPGLRRLDLAPVQSRQTEIDGHRAPYIDFDTAAALHRKARSAGLGFSAVPWETFRESVFHVHGGTRKLLNWLMLNAGSRKESLARAIRRLRSEYRAELSPSLLRSIEAAETTP